MSNGIKSESDNTKKNSGSKNFFESNKLPILITVIFFLSTSYVSFFIDNLSESLVDLLVHQAVGKPPAYSTQTRASGYMWIFAPY